MHTRETHARIYQYEITDNEYRELKRSAKQETISFHELILEIVRKYLENGDPKYLLDIEKWVLNDGGVRFYLWVPYEEYGELDRLMKSRGIHV